MTLPESLLVEDRGAVRVITMNRPDKRNALNNELTQGLLDALRDADQNPAVGAIVLAGAGQSFCAGPTSRNSVALWRAVPMLTPRSRRSNART